jgi:hypothetical protein
MNYRKWIAASCLCVVGCAPMEQAPLVYSSKNQFGVHVTAGAPETPGLEVSIGYKGLDAAFVPVAVAKYCGNSPSPECENEIYKMAQIVGENKAGGSVFIDQAALSALLAKINLQEQDLRRAQEAIVADEALKSANEAQRKRLTDLQAELSTQQGRTIDAADAAEIAKRDARVAEIDADIKAINALEATTSIDQRISNNRASVEALSKSLALDKAARDRTLAARNASSSDDKADAYSVYGSFNGNAQGGRDGADLSLGKVFSTGIAAQNLTQGMGRAARATAGTQCLRQLEVTAKEITDPTRRANFLVDMGRLCGSQDLNLE